MAAEARALPLGPRLALDLGDQQEEEKEEEEEEEKAPEVFPPPAGRCLGVACGVRDTGFFWETASRHSSFSVLLGSTVAS